MNLPLEKLRYGNEVDNLAHWAREQTLFPELRAAARFGIPLTVDTAGVGLGLAIVKKIMEAHRGSAAVRNNADQGAIFTLTFARSSKS
jgi:K+-sensing histidine kinase KdpD